MQIRRTGRAVGIRMNQLAGRCGQMQPVELGHVEFDADRQIILITKEVREIDLSFERSPRLVDHRPGHERISVDDEFNAASRLGLKAGAIDFLAHAFGVDGVANRKIQVCRKARVGVEGFAKAVAPFENKPGAQIIILVNGFEKPSENIVPLDVRMKNVELDGLRFDFVSIDHGYPRPMISKNRRRSRARRAVSAQIGNVERVARQGSCSSIRLGAAAIDILQVKAVGPLATQNRPFMILRLNVCFRHKLPYGFRDQTRTHLMATTGWDDELHLRSEAE